MSLTYQRPPRRYGSKLAAVALGLLATVTLSHTDKILADDRLNFLQSYCIECHAKENREGGLDLQSLSYDLTAPETYEKWVRVYDRIIGGEMPPKSDGTAVKHPFVKTLANTLHTTHATKKGTVLRRLNRQEYENTINDLLGTNLKLAERLPADTKRHEFTNIGESLSISMIQMQQYIDCATLALEEVDRQVSREMDPIKTTVSYANTLNADQWIGKVWLKRDDGAVVFFKNYGYPTGMLREAVIPKDGYYKIRVRGYAYQSEQPITFSIGATTFARGLEQPTFGFYSMPPGQPTTIETTAWIAARYMIELTVYGITDRFALKNTPVDQYQGPGLAILDIEIEGPLPNATQHEIQQRLYGKLQRLEIPPRNAKERSRGDYLPKYELTVSESRSELRETLHQFATRAYRRPVEPSEMDTFVHLFEQELAKNASADEALRTALVAILCSPDFLFIREKENRLNNFEVVSRLAYFLNRTAPDETLLELAQSSKNMELDQLNTQVDRLLQKEDFSRFVTDFSNSWLQLADINFTNPDEKLYPEYDPYLQWSMLAETRAYLLYLIENNRDVVELVQSRYAMLNERLAEHYGINNVPGPDIRYVELPVESVRGGFLSQGAVLKVSSNGTNTSPVVRGAWVTERILGHHVPPPPPGIPGVEPDIRGASTLRDLLAKHRSLDSCNTCHRMIDPPGFALENFDPIGGYREQFRTTELGERINKEILGRKVQYRIGPKVDASGELGDGKTFANYVEFRNLLAENRRQLARAFTEKLLTFATGREMGFSDRDEINRIANQAIEPGKGIRDLVKYVVNSEIFKTK
jgi:hypothetical protein